MRLISRPRLALGILALLVVGPFPLLLSLQLDNAPTVYLPEDAPAVELDEALRERFPEDHVFVLLFEGESLFEQDFLSRLDALATELGTEAAVERVLGVTTADHIAGNDEGFVVERLLNPEAAYGGPPERRERVLNDRFAPGLLVAEDGSALALIVRPHGLADSMERFELQRATLAAVRQYGLEAELSGVAGQIALDVAQLRTMIRDTILFVPATLAIGLVLVGWLFRRWLAVILAALAVGAVVQPTLGLLALSGAPYTLLSAMIPPLLTALTIAALMHLFNAVAFAARRGYQGSARVRRALQEMARPAAFTSLTTAAGLASLAVSPIPPIATFGLTAAAGVALMTGVVLLGMPPLLAHWDRSGWPRTGRGVDRLEHGAGRLTAFAMRRAGWVVAGIALIVVLGLPQLNRVVVETDLYAFFEDSHPLLQSTRRVEEKLSGVTTLEVVLNAPAPDTFTEPGPLEVMASLQDWLDEQPEVDYTASMSDLVEEMNWAFHGEDAAQRSIPEDSALISQYLLIYDGQDLHDLVDRDYQQARIPLNLDVHGAREITAFMGRLEAELASRELGDLRWQIAGDGRLFADQERLLIEGQLRSLIVVVALIGAIMWLLWRRFDLALLSMVPNLAPILLIFIAMGLFGIWLDMATAMIASVAVGIAVDDTIHLLHGFVRRRQAGGSTAAAWLRSSRQAGSAVTATTLILVAQFLLLAQSDFEPTAAFGLLTALGLVVALGFDLVLLPAASLMASRRIRRTA